MEFDKVEIRAVWSKHAEKSLLQTIFMAADGCETGGALIGRYEENDNELAIYIERATGPGRNSYQGRTIFKPELEYYRERVNYYRTKYKWDYLGEWHLHPGEMSFLSYTDLRLAKELLLEEKWPWLYLPVVVRKDDKVVVNGYIVWLDSSSEPAVRKVEEREITSSDILKEVDTSMYKVYLDKRWVDTFMERDSIMEEYWGKRNKVGNFIFFPHIPSPNAVLVLLKGGREIELKTDHDPSKVWVLVSKDGLKAFRIIEGEAKNLNLCLIDPRSDIYKRNIGLLEIKELSSKRVAIVGLGSLGSTIAVELAKAGVGELLLFDPDTLEPHNICRHQANIEYLGMPKVDAVEVLLRMINPEIKVEKYKMDVTTPSSQEIFEREITERSMDMIICTTDTDDSRLYVNDVGLIHGIPVLQVGLHERADSGIIQLVVKGSGACYACHRELILMESAKRSETVAYSEAKDVRDITIQPGLSAQINAVAALAACVAIDFLTYGNVFENKVNAILYVLKDRESSRLKPELCKIWAEKNPNCMYCSEASQSDSGDLPEISEIRIPTSDISDIKEVGG